MTVSVETSRNAYPGNAIAMVFTGPRAFSTSHLIVTLVQDSTGVTVTQAITTNYTVTLNFQSSTITMLVAPPTGYTLNIVRQLPIVQLTDLKNQGAYFPEIHEDEFDYRCMVEQELADGIARSIQQPAGGGFNYDFKQHRGINVGDPVAAQDVVNFRTLQSTVSGAVDFGAARVPLQFPFTGDGATTVFSCPGIAGVSSPLVYIVTLDGLKQTGAVDYTIDDVSETITFTTAPPNLVKIVVTLFGFQRGVLPASNTAGTHTFYRGDGNYAHRLISTAFGPLPSPPPSDTQSMFEIEANAAAALKILTGATSKGSLRFGKNAGVNAWEMEFGYDPSISALYWSSFGSAVYGLFHQNGDIGLGTFNSLFVDRANIRVGIGGQVAPQQALDVIGNVIWTGTATGNMPASNIVSGIVGPSYLGSGAHGVTTFLRGDGQWAVPPGGGGGSGVNISDGTKPSAAYQNILLDGNATTAATKIGVTLYLTNATLSPDAYLYGYLPAGVSFDQVSTDYVSVLGCPNLTGIGVPACQNIKATADNQVLRRTGGVLGFGTIPAASLSATGTQDSAHFLAGDNVWRIPAAASASVALDYWKLNDSTRPLDIFRIKPNSVGGPSTSVLFENWNVSAAAWKTLFALDYTGSGTPKVSMLFDVGTDFSVGSGYGAFKLSFASLDFTGISGAFTLPAGVINPSALIGGAGPYFVGYNAAGPATPIRMTATQSTASLNAMVGDSGAGGTKGLVPAPAAGDAAANKFLKANGVWTAVSGGGTTVSNTATIDLTLSGSDISGIVKAGSIGTNELTNLGVTAGKIANNTITATQVANGAIGSAQLAAGGVNTAALAATAVTVAKVAIGGVAGPTQFLTSDGAGNFNWAAPAGGGSFPGVGSNYAWTGAHSWNTSAAGVTTTLGIPVAITSSAALTMFRNSRPTSDRQGALYFDTYRDGGNATNNALFAYQVSASNTGFDIGATVLTCYAKLAGGTGDNIWFINNSPSSNGGALVAQAWSSGFIRTGEVNFGNRWSDPGIQRDITAATRSVSGLWFVPDTSLTFDGVYPDDAGNAFNASWGIVFARAVYGGTGTGAAGATKAQTWIPIHLQQDCTVPGGVQFHCGGGSVAGQAPAALMEAYGNFQKGIDFTNSTLTNADQEAIQLSPNQCIKFGNAKIYFDGVANKFAFYSPSTGVKYLDAF